MWPRQQNGESLCVLLCSPSKRRGKNVLWTPKSLSSVFYHFNSLLEQTSPLQFQSYWCLCTLHADTRTWQSPSLPLKTLLPQLNPNVKVCLCINWSLTFFSPGVRNSWFEDVMPMNYICRKKGGKNSAILMCFSPEFVWKIEQLPASPEQRPNSRGCILLRISSTVFDRW